jgi:multidrug efflux pump subunit AcrA (membrane-fusion protein)
VTIKDGKALERIVSTGRRGSDWIEITAGLAAGEQVVLDPAGLRSGQPVVIGGSRPVDVTSDAGHTGRTNSKS